MRRFLAIAVCALVWTGHASAATVTKTDSFVTMSDGVQIATSLYVPDGTPPAGGWPAVMIFHGLGQNRNATEFANLSWNTVAETMLAPYGYAVLTFDARAHGQSGGLFDIDGPRTIQDTRELFDWLVAHRNIDRAHVGAFGDSYGGGNVWLSTLAGVPFAANAVAATWTNLATALAPQSLPRTGIVLGFSQDIPTSRYDPSILPLLNDAFAGVLRPEGAAFLASRSVAGRLGSLHVPTFIAQGRRDFAFDTDQALAAYRALPGPKRLYIGDFGHVPAPNPAAEIPSFVTRARAWFDRFLKGIPNGADRVKVELATNPYGRFATYKTLPPTRTLRFAFGGSATLAGNGKVLRTTRKLGRLETFGAPVVTLRASSSTGYPRLVAVLSALTPSGETLVTTGGAATPTLGSRAKTVTIRLQDEVTPIPPGSRIRLTIGSTSTVQNPGNLVYLNPAPETSRVRIDRVGLRLSVLRRPISR